MRPSKAFFKRLSSQKIFYSKYGPQIKIVVQRDFELFYTKMLMQSVPLHSSLKENCYLYLHTYNKEVMTNKLTVLKTKLYYVIVN